eukprot:Phypoly_transcript_02058.p1 GENE.Phypoly_transcript_02058~~Phypoly_transcript_02058.p1  ORF type:complete len:657 (+),score=95.20 Phypoly_transcript_02058:569-2539(+)
MMQNESPERELADIQAIHGLADTVDIFKKGRRFLMKDEMHRLKKSGPAKYPYRVYLFNDMILFTERSSKKSSANYKYVTHMNIKDIFFIECMDSKEKYAFGIMHKDEKKKMKFAAKDNFQWSTWKQTLEKQIEKYCPTDTTFAGGESMITFGSPRNSWNSSMSSEFLAGSMSSLSEFESDGSVHGDSPSNDNLLCGKDDYSSNGSGDEASYSEDTDEARSEGDESECECKEVQHSDGTTIFSHANLHTILWWLINHCDYNSDSILIKTFLHSCLGLTTAPTLFQNLMQIYNLEIPVPKVISLRYSLCDTRKRVTCFMRIWIEFFFDRDFYANKALFSDLIDFFGELQKNNQERDANVLKLVIIRVNKKKIADKGMNRFLSLIPAQQTSPAPKLLNSRKSAQHNSLPQSVGPSDSKFIDWNLNVVAEQFVLIEFALFKAVDLKEISNMAWKSDHPRKTSPNVINIFTRFDLVSQWAATEVVMAQSPKQRVLTIEKLIALAQKCLELRNYNSLMEIIAGLNRGSVQRMKKTWEVVTHTSRETFKSLNSVVDSLQNYKNYREQLRRAVSPCLPYFGIFLRDLTFTDVGNPSKIGDNINFEKIYMTSRILKEIQGFQSKPYSFEEDEVLTPLLRRLLAMPEELLYKHSQTIEPSSLAMSN